MDTIGFHVNKTYCTHKGATIEQNIAKAEKKYNLRLRTAQIFVANPRSFRFSVNGEEQEQSLKEFIKRTGIHIYAHARYLDNVFSTEVKNSTLGFVRKEIKICEEVGIKGFVLHLYRYPSHRVIESLEVLNPSKDVKIILETPAISPDKAIYNSASALIELWNATKKAKLNCGICVDTCHIYAAGLNIAEKDVIQDFFMSIIKCIPSTDILIHLNDSSAALGSGRDRHASLGEGLIWDKTRDSLKWLIEFIRKYEIDTILERSEGNGDLNDDFKMIELFN